MSYDITWNEDGTILRFNGITTIHHINSANEKLYADPRFDGHRYQVWDLLEADFSSITTEDIEGPAATDMGAAFSNPKMKVAIIANNKHTQNISFNYIDLSKALNSTWSFLICDTLEEAMKWAKK